jgi:hypothetical protein
MEDKKPSQYGFGGRLSSEFPSQILVDVPEVEIANVIIPDYETEETLLEDIQTILAAGYVNEEVMKKLTSTIVYT